VIRAWGSSGRDRAPHEGRCTDCDTVTTVRPFIVDNEVSKRDLCRPCVQKHIEH
jgi:hypothetical protein